MAFSVGDPVQLSGATGRICRINQVDGSACVQFEDGCELVDLDDIQHAASTTVVCTASCSAGCI